MNTRCRSAKPRLETLKGADKLCATFPFGVRDQRHRIRRAGKPTHRPLSRGGIARCGAGQAEHQQAAIRAVNKINSRAAQNNKSSECF